MFTDANDTLVLASVTPEPTYDGFESIAAAADTAVEDLLMESLENEVRSFVELTA